MSLRDLVTGYSIKRVTRNAFPKGIAVKNACVRFEAAAPVQFDEDAQDRIHRILRAFAQQRQTELNHRDIRFIASVIGSEFVTKSDQFRAILRELTRRDDPRLYRALFVSFLNYYQSQEVRSSIRECLKPRVNVFRSDVANFIHASNILVADEGLDAFAATLAAGRNLYSACIANGVSSRIISSNYGTELKVAVLTRVMRGDADEAIELCLDWIFNGVQGVPVGNYYEAMISPYELRQPRPSLQRILMSRVIEKYKDPRLYPWPIPSGPNGERRRDSCVSILKRWLSIQYLDLFIDIIEATAVDRQFKPRKQFWLQYFEKDKISDVTLILATDASNVARRMRSEAGNADYMQWAKLIQAASDQSVLLMRLGDLVIAEWSHNGAIRFWKVGAKSAPEFHLREYEGSQLRQNSLSIRVGNSNRSSIRHHENGEWMRWAANTIKHFTGVTV